MCKTVKAASEFRELERLRERARHNEASALRYAEQKGEAREREKWETVVADKDANYAKVIADKDSALADKDALIAELRARLGDV